MSVGHQVGSASSWTGSVNSLAVATSKSLDAVVQEIQEISTLPHVALRLLKVANDENASAADLKSILEADASLSARVLRYANSSASALRTKVTNLQHAISYLGFNQVRNLAMTASVSELFRGEGSLGSYNRSKLWRHHVAVGLCARLIAMRQRLTNFEDAFLAGLLHDIGIILEDQHLHDRFQRMLLALDPEKTLQDNEREYLGFDHAELGGAIAKAWSFPDAAHAAIRYHHSSHRCQNEHTRIVQCVEVANLICTMKNIPSVGINLIEVPESAIQSLGLKEEDIHVLTNDLDGELSLHNGLLSL